MQRKSFTLVEILAAMVVLAILVSLSVAAYQKTVQSNEDRICKQNLKVLKTAIDIYVLENNSLPVSLSLLTPEQIYLAYQKVTGHYKENPVLAFLKTLTEPKCAHADLGKYYGNNPKTLKCPSDKSSASESYVMNTSVFSSKDNYTDSANTNKAVLYDSDDYHKKSSSSQTYQLGITPNGTIGEQVLSGSTVISDNIEIPDPTINPSGTNYVCSANNGGTSCCPKPSKHACKVECVNDFDRSYKYDTATHKYECVECTTLTQSQCTSQTIGCAWDGTDCVHQDYNP